MRINSSVAREIFEWAKGMVKKLSMTFPLLGNVIEIFKRLQSTHRIIGKGNVISKQGTIVRLCSFDIIGNDNLIEIGEYSEVRSARFHIRGDGHRIIIGEHCRIEEGLFCCEDFGCLIQIGDKTTIESAHIAASETKSKIQIGIDCMLSSGIAIRSGDGHSIIDLNNGSRINLAQDIIIDDHVWIAHGVQILKGVHIGKNVVVGCGSIVSKDIPDNSIAVGIPARVVRNNVDWQRERATFLSNEIKT